MENKKSHDIDQIWICHYCAKNKADKINQINIIKFPWYRSFLWWNYLKAKINIPLCSKCRSIQNTLSLFTWIIILSLSLYMIYSTGPFLNWLDGILSFIAIFIFFVAIYWIFAYYIKYVICHFIFWIKWPEELWNLRWWRELREEGWCVGYKPTEYWLKYILLLIIISALIARMRHQ